MKFNELLSKLTKDKKNPAKYYKDEINFSAEISNLITEARIYAGITQQELADLIHTKQSGVARWEAATSLPSLRSLKKIADALDTYLIPPKFGFMEEISINEESTAKHFVSNADYWLSSNIDNSIFFPVCAISKSSETQHEELTVMKV